MIDQPIIRCEYLRIEFANALLLGCQRLIYPRATRPLGFVLGNPAPHRRLAKGQAAPLLARIKEIAATRVHYGYRRMQAVLQRESWKENHKRVYRLYRAEGLSMRISAPSANTRGGSASPKALSRLSTKVEAWIWSTLPCSMADACAR
ncbi:IS3 family transposase [Ralstonia pickettii]|uniref:IS3 family transposase n=1 Tax=Ralstonia pickettii TaxID=329 RepID=UPI0015DDA15D